MSGSYGYERSVSRLRQGGDLRDEFGAERADPRGLVDELRRLDADGRETPGELGRNRGQRLVEAGDPVGAGEHAADAAHELDLGRAAPGRDQRTGQPGQPGVAWLAERVESGAVP